MNSTTSTRIKQAMNSSNLKQIDIVNKAKSLEKETGIKLTKTDLRQYVNGKKLYILAKILNVSEAWLLGYDVDRARIDDKSRAEFNQQQDTMAAHLDYSDLTEDDQKEVEQFIQFIRNRKK